MERRDHAGCDGAGLTAARQILAGLPNPPTGETMDAAAGLIAAEVGRAWRDGERAGFRRGVWAMVFEDVQPT